MPEKVKNVLVLARNSDHLKLYGAIIDWYGVPGYQIKTSLCESLINEKSNGISGRIEGGEFDLVVVSAWKKDVYELLGGRILDQQIKAGRIPSMLLLLDDASDYWSDPDEFKKLLNFDTMSTIPWDNQWFIRKINRLLDLEPLKRN